MIGELLPSKDHTARYCPPSKILEDGSVSAIAFYLRPGEPYVSVEWLECLNQPTRHQEIRAVVGILAQKLSLKGTAGIAVTHIRDVCDYVSETSGFKIRFVYEPESNDPAHSGIYGTDQDEMMIAELIAEKVTEMHAVREFLAD